MNWSFKRLFLSYLASIYIRIITKLPLLDPTGGFNAYSKKALKLICQNKISSKGYAFQAEVKHLLWKNDLKFYEKEITFYERQKGQSKMSQNIIFEAIIKIIIIRLKYLFNRKKI